ncbi:hypothetical protein A9Q81_06580 [Gammaproteobacteria bacterium 42_54_T18]|nr:hypothetical protein A9Q81_06580 [Gammaproteobacteria bacterium 42_54_T18]
MNANRQMIVRGFILVLFFVASAVVGVVIYTHWSIRQLITPIPSNEVLFDLLDVEGGPTSINYIVTASLQDRLRGEIVFPAFVLRWADGRRFVIDMGMDESGAKHFYEKMAWQYESDDIKVHGSVVQQLGAEASLVAGLGFTHLHEDHVQGVQRYCQPQSIKLPLFQTPQQAEERNYTTGFGAAFVEDAGCVSPQALIGAGPLYSVPGFPGLAAIPVAGHSPGSTVFVAAVEGTLWIVAGDISWTRESMLINQPKQVSLFRSFIIPEDGSRLIELREWLAQLDSYDLVKVLLCHDGLALQVDGPSEFKPPLHKSEGR